MHFQETMRERGLEFITSLRTCYRLQKVSARKRKWKDNTVYVYLKDTGRENADWIHTPGQGQLASSCEHGTKSFH